ncbi:hypothetical protein ACFQ0T_00250 [Kitasatospora gansuensis]
MSTRPSRPVVLTKGGSARISLAKADPEAKITCTLSWQGRENGQRSDLDLFALHVPAEAVSSAAAATTDAVDHRTLGSLTAAPHLLHSGDSTAPGSETVTIGGWTGTATSCSARTRPSPTASGRSAPTRPRSPSPTTGARPSPAPCPRSRTSPTGARSP